MPKYVAFLRAINVGGHTVKMDELRRLFEEMQLSNVETFIASGNVIFDSRAKADALEQKIEKQLKNNLGYEAATFIRTIPELAAIRDYEPFSKAELSATGHTLYVGLLQNPPSKQVIKNVEALRGAADDLHLNNREVYWLLRRSFRESEVAGPRLEKALGMKTTFRNVNTIKRLVDKYS